MNTNLSIITINLNDKRGLEKTIKSVVDQKYKSFEHIIIDGESSDGSIQVIDQYKHKISYWVSEQDNGIYEAMNKGIRVAKGEYCLFLNSGDWLVDSDTLDKVFADELQADIVSGDIFFYDNQKSEIKWLISSPEQITAKVLFLGTLPHQATFVRRSLFNTIGPYNETLKITSDWLFFMEALLIYNCTYKHYKGVISYFNMNGISCNPDTNFLPRQEQLKTLQQKYPLFLPDYEYFDILEKKMQKWNESREFKVYKFLEALGVIRLGVFCQRVKRTFKRKALSKT